MAEIMVINMNIGDSARQLVRNRLKLLPRNPVIKKRAGRGAVAPSWQSVSAYSERSTLTRSTRMTRRAGMKQANIAIASRKRPTAQSVEKSWGFTP